MLLTKLSQEEKNILPFQKQWEIVLRKNNVFNKLKAVITKLENKIEKKKVDEEGKKRKERIVSRLLNCKTNLTLVESLNKGVLPLFNQENQKN